MSGDMIPRIFVAVVWSVIGISWMVNKDKTVPKMDYLVTWAALMVYVVETVLRGVLGT